MMRLRYILLFATLLLASAHAQDLRIRQQDAGGLLIEYRPSATVTRLPSGETRVDIVDGVSAFAVGDPRVPQLRTLLGLPSTVGNRVTVVEMDYRDEQGVDLAPVTIPRQDDEEITTPRGPLYSASGFIPASIASLEHVGIARDRMFGDLVLNAAQYNPATRVLRVYTRLVLRVDFGSARERFATVTPGEEVPSQLLNASQARAWKLQRPAAIAKSTANSLASGAWYRITVAQTGVYRLSRAWFSAAGIDVAALDPRTIRLFSSGGRELPRDLDAKRPEPLQEVAIEVVGGDDGRFDEDDYVQFFGMGTSGFDYNPASGLYEHYINRFADENVFLMTFGGVPGKRIAQQASLSDPQPYTPAWFNGREFEEEEVTNLMNSGSMWFGKRLIPGAGSASSIAYTRRLHGLVRNEPVVYRVQVVGSSEVTHGFTVRDGERELGSISLGTVSFASEVDDVAKISGPRTFSGTGQLPDDRATVTLTYSSSSSDRSRGGYVDWVEWHYARRFEPLNDELLFSAPDTTAVVEFVINGFTTSDIVLYDVTDWANVTRIANANISGGTVRFQVSNERGNPRQFLAVARPALKTAPAPVGVPNSGLLTQGGAEFVIITNDQLAEAAQRLKAHRERAGEDRISTTVVRLSEIYNEFASTLPDLTAIRDFVAHAVKRWPTPPRYVLFLGDGHFDYRNRTTAEPILLPVVESENSINKIDSYVSDDYYAKVVGTPRNDARVDVATGRIPVMTLAEANAVVDKIIRYETQPAFEPWRNHVTFVADDGWNSSRDSDGPEHTAQSERLTSSVPASMDQRKIYIVSYRTEITASGRRKPDAAAAIVDQINQGTLLVNYTGHGAHDVWTQERIFVSDVTVPQLTNADRLTFMCAATCTFGLYDAPGVRSGTELLLLKPDGGSIGALSSPRVVFSDQNSAFNKEFLENLLNKGREDDGRAKRLGEAIYSTKQRYSGVAGYEKFHLFGDPTTRLALPRYAATLEEIRINDEAVSADTVQLRALSKVTLQGSVRDGEGRVWEGFSGTTDVSLFDADRYVVINDPPKWINYTYRLQGGLLYRGKASIANGRFTVSFIVPKDISYENNNGRLAMYFDNAAVDGAGFFADLRVGGSDTSSVQDETGPVIALYMDTRTFRPGDMVNSETTLLADLFDESGINTTGLGIGHNLEAWLDNGSTGIVLNDYYTGEVDSYQKGTVTYRFRGLEPGQHTLRLRAYDIFNNSSMAETWFTVAGSSDLTLADVLNYPNPMRDETSFTFRHNLGNPVNVDIKIYTLSGRQVRVLEARNIAERFVAVPWDGRDEDGDALSNGVYLYKVICRTVDGGMGSEVLGRLSLLR